MKGGGHGFHGAVSEAPAREVGLATVSFEAHERAQSDAPEHTGTVAEHAQGFEGFRIVFEDFERVWTGSFAGIDRIEEAEPLRNAKLWLPLSELPELEDAQFYFHDVIGFQVVDETEGPLGTVENFYELPQQDVLAMRYQGQEVLIPVVDELVSHADMETRQLFVNLPEGLLDIYLNPGAHKNPNAD